MTFDELVTATAKRSGMTKKDVRQVLRDLADVMGSGLDKGENVRLQDVGLFIHDMTNKRVVFKPSAALRDRIA